VAKLWLLRTSSGRPETVPIPNPKAGEAVIHVTRTTDKTDLQELPLSLAFSPKSEPFPFLTL
jgi:hypothetical protein